MRIITFSIILVLMFSGCVNQQTTDKTVDSIPSADTRPSVDAPQVSQAAVQEEAASMRSEAVDSIAPDFTLSDADGEPLILSSLRGQWVVLYFYPKDGTPGCTVEANDFTQLEASFNDLNAKVIGVSPDSVDSHKAFIQEHDLGVQLLSDGDLQVMTSYGAWVQASLGDKNYGRVIRSTFLIDPQGTIRYHWPEVIPDGHAGRVLQKLKEIQDQPEK